jgi:hypothetical protein
MIKALIFDQPKSCLWCYKMFPVEGVLYSSIKPLCFPTLGRKMVPRHWSKWTKFELRKWSQLWVTNISLVRIGKARGYMAKMGPTTLSIMTFNIMTHSIMAVLSCWVSQIRPLCWVSLCWMSLLLNVKNKSIILSVVNINGYQFNERIQQQRSSSLKQSSTQSNWSLGYASLLSLSLFSTGWI